MAFQPVRMIRILFLLSFILCLFPREQKAALDRTYGAGEDEEAFAVQTKKNGGYILGGYTFSKGKGESDGWVLNLNERGDVTWERTYGTEGEEKIHDIQQTREGGYVFCGMSCNDPKQGPDMWIVKIDQKGDVTWEKLYGRPGNDMAYSVRQTRDSSYIIAGSTEARPGFSTDFWIIKLDANGNFLWEKIYGGKSYEEAYCIQQTAEGGYIAAGSTQSKGEGGFDLWVLKLDQSGMITWEKTFGGANTDEGRSICQTSDKGYVVAGYNDSKAGGFRDAWILKLDGSGNLAWDKNFGGMDVDEARSVVETSDNGFLAAGFTTSKGEGASDGWLIRLDKKGELLWEKTFGGKDDDLFYSIGTCPEGGFIAAGSTGSRGAGAKDIWMLKLDQSGKIK
ncbi:MAG: hypothetical protein PHF84_08445 [bacterium]|nr:hypothetical protein [bacterium]